MLKKLSYTLLFSALLLSCAHQLAPSGGPIDEMAPTLIYQYPKTADVRIPTDAKIELLFSEWVDPKNASKSITIFPILKDGFDVRVSGKRVTIKPNSKFEDSTTYHVGLSTELTDVHTVKIPKPLDIIFSTGSKIDTLTITGCIPDIEREKNQPRIALFKYEENILEDTVLLGDPRYLTQTDSLGRFELTHIKEGKYFILGFIDNNKDNRLTAGTEKAFVYPKKTITAGSDEEIHLFYSIADTSINNISSPIALSPTLLSAMLKKSYIKTDMYSKYLDLKISTNDSIEKEVQIKETVLTENEKTLLIKLKDSLSMGQYKLTYSIERAIPYYSVDTTSKDSSLLRDTIYSDTLIFNGTNKKDSLDVKFQSCSKTEDIPINEDIILNWSGLVKAQFNKILITDTTGDTTALIPSKGYSNKTMLTPSKDLVMGTEYLLLISDSLFTDLNGNSVTINEPIDTSDTTLSDSLIELSLKDKGEIYLTTILPGDLCNSLSAVPTCSDIKPQFTALTFTYENGKKLTTTFNGQNFLFINLPAGNGSMKWFKDLNYNEKRDPGSLFPWTEPEFQYTFSDTVEARAKWDIENVPLNDCFICNPTEDEVDTVKTNEK